MSALVQQHWHKTLTKEAPGEFCCIRWYLAIVNLQVALEAQEDFYRLMARGKLGQTGFRTWLRTSAYTIQQVTNSCVPGVAWLWCCTYRTTCWACKVSDTMDLAAHQKHR